MHPEEVIDQLQKKVDGLSTALENLLDAIVSDTNISTETAIAAGTALNELRGVEIPFTS